jgi:hypothetical protein
VLERSGKEKSQSERVLKENENTRTTHKQREEPLLVACSSVVKQPEVVFVFFFCWTKERKFPTRNLKAAAAREEGEDISLKDDHQYQQRRRDDKLRSSGERIHVAVRSHETIHERRRRRRVGIVAVLL